MRDGFRSARWIWVGTSRPNTYIYFARRFATGKLGGSPRIRVSADTRYVLYLNGVPIGRGPVQSQPYYQYYDTYSGDLPLQTGTGQENLLTAVVYHLGHVEDARGGFLLEMDVDGEVVVATDESWKALQSAAWWEETFYFRFNLQAPYQEIFDARRQPEGWPRPDVDSWPRATEIPGHPPQAGPWSRLVSRDIPHMRTEELPPWRVEYVEESLAQNHRERPVDLTLELSARGRPLERAMLENPERLCGERASSASEATRWRCSTDHLDGVFDGMYDPCIVLDFGRIRTAYLAIDIELPDGASLDVGFTERLKDGSFVNSIENKYAARFFSAGGRQVFQTFNWMSFRFVKLRLRGCTDVSTLHSVRGVDVRYPFEELGLFASSDSRLTGIWELSRTTIDLCSKEAIMDTPWREQAQWLGDVAAVTLGGIYACYGDTMLPAKFLRQSAANLLPLGVIANMTNSTPRNPNRTIPDYSLWWITAVWEHYLYGGDYDLLRELYPVVLRILGTVEAHLDEDGLVAWMPYWPFIDWADVDTRGQSTAFNGIYAAALDAGARISDAYGDSRAAEHSRALLRGLSEHFVERLYDPDRGLFADANVNGVLSDKMSEHANVMAVGGKLCNPELANRVLDTLYPGDELQPGVTRAEPFFTWQVLKTLVAAGRFATATAILRRRWGWMLDRGQTSASEEWGRHGSWRSGEYDTFARTESHAWSAAPAEFLTKLVAGVEILEPGCRRVRITPQTDGLPDYTIRYPTPEGVIVVEYRDGELRVAVPDGIVVEES